MREVVWRDLRLTDGVVQDDPATWRRSTPRRGLPRAKRHPAFQKMLGPQVRQMADALLGAGWTPSAGLGQLLVDFRDADRWHLPGRDGHWHLDTSWSRGMDRLESLRLFAIFGEIPPGGGGTLLVVGSPYFVRRHVADSADQVPRDRETDEASALPVFRSHPWLAELTLSERPDDWDADYEEARRHKFVDTPTDLGGTPVQVVEACGRPGDVYVCHPWTIHCRPPISADGPRFIRSPTLYASAD